jgi:hypothetical protein
MKKLQDSPITTIAGAGLGAGTIVLSLLPTEVRDGCMAAVMDSNNPLVVSILLLAALLLTVIGPSLASRNKETKSK